MKEKNDAFVNDTMDLEGIRDLLKEEYPAQEERAAAPETETVRQSAGHRKKQDSTFGEEVYSLIHDIVYILAVLTIVFVFLVRLVRVDGESMMPTLYNNDFLLLESNFLYHPDHIENGDIVVLSVPYYAQQGPIVKRVIATEGQTVDIDFDLGIVYVDGQPLEDAYTSSLTTANWDPPYALEYPATVPENCIFVLGDNRNYSTDSRFAPVGMIDESCVLGKAFMIVFPGKPRDNSKQVIGSIDLSRIGAVS